MVGRQSFYFFFFLSREQKTGLQMSQVSLITHRAANTGQPSARVLASQAAFGGNLSQREAMENSGGRDSAPFLSKERHKAGKVRKWEARPGLMGRTVRLL